jgi:hypothetical protein
MELNDIVDLTIVVREYNRLTFMWFDRTVIFYEYHASKDAKSPSPITQHDCQVLIDNHSVRILKLMNLITSHTEDRIRKSLLKFIEFGQEWLTLSKEIRDGKFPSRLDCLKMMEDFHTELCSLKELMIYEFEEKNFRSYSEYTARLKREKGPSKPEKNKADVGEGKQAFIKNEATASLIFKDFEKDIKRITALIERAEVLK